MSSYGYMVHAKLITLIVIATGPALPVLLQGFHNWLEQLLKYQLGGRGEGGSP